MTELPTHLPKHVTIIMDGNGRWAKKRYLPREAGHYAGFVWKTIADPFAGRITMLRVVSGTLKSDATVCNLTRDASERLGHLLFTAEPQLHQDLTQQLLMVAAPLLFQRALHLLGGHGAAVDQQLASTRAYDAA